MNESSSPGGMADLLGAHQRVSTYRCKCGAVVRTKDAEVAHQALALTLAGYGDTRALLADLRLAEMPPESDVRWLAARIGWHSKDPEAEQIARDFRTRVIGEMLRTPVIQRALLARHTHQERP